MSQKLDVLWHSRVHPFYLRPPVGRRVLVAVVVRGRYEDTSDDAVLTIVVVEYIDVERLDEKVETGGRVEEEGTVIVAIDGDGRVESG